MGMHQQALHAGFLFMCTMKWFQFSLKRIPTHFHITFYDDSQNPGQGCPSAPSRDGSQPRWTLGWPICRPGGMERRYYEVASRLSK